MKVQVSNAKYSYCTDNKRKRKIREIPDMMYSCTTGHRDNTSADVYKSIRVDLFLPVVNRIESELKRRFSTDALNILASLACVLCPSSEQFLVFKAIEPLLSVYAKTCGINEALLNAEMTVAMNMLRESLGENLPKSDFHVVLKLLLPSLAFPNLRKCIQIALTIPVTSASCERSFSAMKLLKTHLRNKTEDDRLSDLAVLFVHKQRARLLDCDNVIDEFANAKNRRIQFS